MTIQEKIVYLISKQYSQTFIYEKTGIHQSSVSKILNGEQTSVSYQKGVALDSLVKACIEENFLLDEPNLIELNNKKHVQGVMQ